MLDTFSLTPSVAEFDAILELRSWLEFRTGMAPAPLFEALSTNNSIIEKMHRYLSRDDNALMVDLLAEISSTSGLDAGHMIGSSVILADKLFIEPVFEQFGLTTYPVNFGTIKIEHDEIRNRISGMVLLRSIGIKADSLMTLVRGTKTGRIGIAAIRMCDLVSAEVSHETEMTSFTIDARPRHYRAINEAGVEKAIKDVCVTNFALALGVLRSARLATEIHVRNHILFGRSLGQNQITQTRLAQAVVNEELLRCLAIRQHSEFSALGARQVALVDKVRYLVQQTLTELAHLHGAESVLGRTEFPFLHLKKQSLGLIDDAVT